MRIHPAILAQATATIRPARSTAASRGASGPARRSTSTSSVTAGHRPTCGSTMLEEAIDVDPPAVDGRAGDPSRHALHGGERPHLRPARAAAADRRVGVRPAGGRAGGPDRRRAVGDRRRRRDDRALARRRRQRVRCTPSSRCAGPRTATRRSKTAHRIWPNTGVPGQLSQDLPTPAHFEQAVERGDRGADRRVDGLRARPRAGRRADRARWSTPGSTTSTSTRSAPTRKASAGSGPRRSSRSCTPPEPRHARPSSTRVSPAGRGRPGQAGQRDLHDRPDPEGEGHRADAHRSAEQGAGDEHRDLDQGPGEPDRPAASDQPGHQPVSRTGPEPGTDVQPGADPKGDDAATSITARTATLCGSGSRGSSRSTTVPISIALRNVPGPGRTCKGIQTNSSASPTRTMTVPDRESGVLTDALMEDIPRGTRGGRHR